MTLMNPTLARSFSVNASLFAYTASQQLMDVLLCHRFVEMPHSGSKDQPTGNYTQGQVYYLRKHGSCTINFLKDGRVHILQGPIAMWNLRDSLSAEDLNILIAFATLSDEQQEVMRNYMGPRCRKFTDVLPQMPPFDVDWKREFLQAYARLD